MLIKNILKKIANVHASVLQDAISKLSKDDTSKLIKNILGVPSEVLHDMISNLSEEDKVLIKNFAEALVKAAVSSAIQSATEK